MKALTVKNPWAWAIINAGKDIENRSWRTLYRGPLAIHAAASPRTDAQLPRGVPRPDPEDLVDAAILGVVDLIDVVERSKSKWFQGEFGWVLANPRRLSSPLPCKGRLGLWSLSTGQLRAVRNRLT
jgi:hypothetical protein